MICFYPLYRTAKKLKRKIRDIKGRGGSILKYGIANDTNKKINTDFINSLCKEFNCQIEDVFEFAADEIFDIKNVYNNCEKDFSPLFNLLEERKISDWSLGKNVGLSSNFIHDTKNKGIDTPLFSNIYEIAKYLEVSPKELFAIKGNKTFDEIALEQRKIYEDKKEYVGIYFSKFKKDEPKKHKKTPILYSEDFKAKVIDEYKQNILGVEPLARKHGINEKTIRRWLIRAKVPANPIKNSMIKPPIPISGKAVLEIEYKKWAKKHNRNLSKAKLPPKFKGQTFPVHDYSDYFQNEVIEIYKKNTWSLKYISKTYNISIPTARKWIDDAGIERSPIKSITDDDDWEI